MLGLGEICSVDHAYGLVVDKAAVAGDGDGGGRDGELAAELSGYAAHLAALLAIGAEGLGLGEGFDCGESCGGGGEGKVLEEGTAGEGAIWHLRECTFDWPT